MGAWGVSTFENDDAVAWLEELLESDNLLILYSTFELVDEEYVECPDACNALAAAEIVAALNGNPRACLPEQAAKWVESYRDGATMELTELAIAAVDKASSDESELRELWQDADEYDEWLADISSLKNSLEA